MPHRGSSYAVKGSISKPNPPEIPRIGYAHPDSPTFGLSDKCDEALFFLSAVRQLPPESDASVRQSSSPGHLDLSKEAGLSSLKKHVHPVVRGIITI
jgi:hypothetical protein